MKADKLFNLAAAADHARSELEMIWLIERDLAPDIVRTDTLGTLQRRKECWMELATALARIIAAAEGGQPLAQFYEGEKPQP